MSRVSHACVRPPSLVFVFCLPTPVRRYVPWVGDDAKRQSGQMQRRPHEICVVLFRGKPGACLRVRVRIFIWRKRRGSSTDVLLIVLRCVFFFFLFLDVFRIRRGGASQVTGGALLFFVRFFFFLSLTHGIFFLFLFLCAGLVVL